MAEPSGEHVAEQCQNCKQSLRAYFEIKHFNAEGREAPKSIKVCSVKCLITWGYTYGVQRGAQGIMMVKEAITKITNTMKGA